MVKNLKFLLLAAIVLFASVALAKSSGVEDGDEKDERRRDLGEGERESKGIEGSGFRAFKVNRFTDAGNDTIVFSFRAFPVPRVRVRYFDGEIDDIDVENNDIEEKLELIAAIPGWFVYTEGDDEPGFNATTDTITQKFSLRRENGNAWAVPVLDSIVVDGVQIFKLTVTRKTEDFSFVSYVANDTVTYDGFDLVADAIKFNVIAFPGASSGLVLTADERLAVVVKVHFRDGVDVEDRSEENEERARAGQPELSNDVLIASADSDVSAYFNWEKTVTVYYEDQTSQVLDLVSTLVSAKDLDFDRPPSGVSTFDGGNSISGPGGDGGKNSSFGGDGGKNSTSGGSGSNSTKEDYPDYPEPNKEHGDFNESSEESDDEREERDNRGSYSSSEEDGAISGRLDNDQIYVFAIDGSLATATEVVWDPDSGATTVTPTTVTDTDTPTAAPTTATTTGSGAETSSITIVKVLVAIFAIVAVLM